MSKQVCRILDQGACTLSVSLTFVNLKVFFNWEQGMELEWCRQPEIGLPKPDAVLYLTLSAEEAAKRTEFGGERYEQTDFQRKVGENYKLLKEQDWKVNILIYKRLEFTRCLGGRVDFKLFN